MALGVSSSEVELRVSLRDVRNKDAMSKSDPFVVVSVYSDLKPEQGFVEVGRSEVVRDNLNPDFVHAFQITYYFEEQQRVKIRAYDEDQKGTQDLSRHTLIGEVECVLGALMATPGQSATLHMGRHNTTVIVRAEEMGHCSDVLTLQLRGCKLTNKDGMFGKSDPFYTISKIREDNSFVKVHQSETVMDNLNPTFALVTISTRSLCNGDYDVPLRIELWDFDKDGSHDSMGACMASIRQLLAPGATFELIDERKRRTKGYKNSGTLQVVQAQVVREPSFLEYLKTGMQVSLMVAIDFTGSNGVPTDPNSLHFIKPGGLMNDYQYAISAVGTVVETYDSDKKFPVYGFGGQPAADQPVSHCFALTPGVEVQGVAGILSAYADALPRVRLSGPTLFVPVLGAAMNKAQQAAQAASMGQPLVYTILLIITDGVIGDMDAVQKMLSQAAGMPLSVIIIGVGSADFSQMTRLDGDDCPRKAAGSRDIVQFIPMEKYLGRNMAHLARDTLVEIPGQFLAFAKAARVLPRAA